jgi:2,4-dienoyl-CoA reductase-like NADH-dependent reductase (Old Yellow Enzyme family)
VLDTYGIAYLHVIEPRIKGDGTLHEGHPPAASKCLRPFFSGPVIAAGGFDREGAEAIVEAGTAGLLALGASLHLQLRFALPAAEQNAAHRLCPCSLLGRKRARLRRFSRP